MTMRIEADFKGNASCFVTIRGEKYKLHHLFIHDSKCLIGLIPTVKHVDVVCFHVGTRKKHTFTLQSANNYKLRNTI